MLVLWTSFKTSKGSKSCSKKRKENDIPKARTVTKMKDDVWWQDKV
jgi:hypothetical protein